MTNQRDEMICPLCGNPNNCMAHSEHPCWCLDVKVPKELIELLPVTHKGKACICLDCIQKFNKGSNISVHEFSKLTK
jgi:hypothetical protein